MRNESGNRNTGFAEQNGIEIESRSNGTAVARFKTVSLSAVKKNRHRREVKLIKELSPDQIEVLNDALHILANTKSTWIVNIFKLAASTRSTELSYDYSEPEMSFEVRGNAYSEIWRNPLKNKKIYESITSELQLLPSRLFENIYSIAKRVVINRKKKDARKEKIERKIELITF